MAHRVQPFSLPIPKYEHLLDPNHRHYMEEGRPVRLLPAQQDQGRQQGQQQGQQGEPQARAARQRLVHYVRVMGRQKALYSVVTWNVEHVRDLLFDMGEFLEEPGPSPGPGPGRAEAEERGALSVLQRAGRLARLARITCTGCLALLKYLNDSDTPDEDDEARTDNYQELLLRHQEWDAARTVYNMSDKRMAREKAWLAKRFRMSRGAGAANNFYMFAVLGLERMEAEGKDKEIMKETIIRYVPLIAEIIMHSMQQDTWMKMFGDKCEEIGECFLITFFMSDRLSMEDAEFVYRLHNKNHCRKNWRTALFLGYNYGLKGNKEVSVEEGEALAKKYNGTFIEISVNVMNDEEKEENRVPTEYHTYVKDTHTKVYLTLDKQSNMQSISFNFSPT